MSALRGGQVLDDGGQQRRGRLCRLCCRQVLCEIIIDVPMALGLMMAAGAWPVKAAFELKNGTLTAPESEITVSPR